MLASNMHKLQFAQNSLNSCGPALTLLSFSKSKALPHSPSSPAINIPPFGHLAMLACTSDLSMFDFVCVTNFHNDILASAHHIWISDKWHASSLECCESVQYSADAAVILEFSCVYCENYSQLHTSVTCLSVSLFVHMSSNDIWDSVLLTYLQHMPSY